MSRVPTDWTPFRAWTRNHRAELALSLRVTIAALLSFALSNLLIIRLPLWTVLTAVILTQVNFGRSQLGAQRENAFANGVWPNRFTRRRREIGRPPAGRDPPYHYVSYPCWRRI